jgi:hypothetical protein
MSEKLVFHIILLDCMYSNVVRIRASLYRLALEKFHLIERCIIKCNMVLCGHHKQMLDFGEISYDLL